MRLSFDVPPGDPAPQVQPLGPGKIWFVHYKLLEGVGGIFPPEHTTAATDEANYNNWPLRGYIQYKPSKEIFEEGLLTREQGNFYFWYGPVKLTRDFLFRSVSHRNGEGLEKQDVRGIKVTDPRWSNFAISKFLKGNHEVTLQLNDSNDPTTHDVVAKPMPRVVVENDHVDLNIIIAIAPPGGGKPQDGKIKDLNIHYSDPLPARCNPAQSWAGLPRDPMTVARGGHHSRDPRHPWYSPVPASLVFDDLKEHFIDLPPSTSQAYLGLFPGGTPMYSKIQFTRTWQNVPNWSAYFPGQTVKIVSEDVPGASTGNPALLLESKLPTTGTVYLRQTDPRFQHVSVSLPSDLIRLGTFLRGEYVGTDNKPWEKRGINTGSTTSLLYDLTAHPEPHIIVRRPFFYEMMREEPGKVKVNLCTYMSLRRFLLAFLDHRITGGRILSHLNSRWGRRGAGTKPTLRTDNVTRDLLNEARAGLASSVEDTLSLNNYMPIFGTVRPRDLKHKPPTPPNVGKFKNLYEEKKARAVKTHRYICEKLYPEPKWPNFNKGRVFWHLWHSGLSVFAKEWNNIPNDTKNHLKSFIGMGAPGAAKYVGLIQDYAFSSKRSSGVVSDDEYVKTITCSMLATTLPGALLKWNNDITDFEDMTMRFENNIKVVDSTRRWRKLKGAGHSLVFAKREVNQNGKITGVWVADYFVLGQKPDPPESPEGLRFCPVIGTGNSKCTNTTDGKNIDWRGYEPEIWVAANWTEE
jgi:hypothetical protein